jgi:hypothetical protein
LNLLILLYAESRKLIESMRKYTGKTESEQEAAQANFWVRKLGDFEVGRSLLTSEQQSSS